MEITLSQDQVWAAHDFSLPACQWRSLSHKTRSGQRMTSLSLPVNGDHSLTRPDVCRVIELLEKLQRSGEVPPPKLQALQRVLQSKFCAAIREVYEQLYDTLDISGGAEIRAQATAKCDVSHLGCDSYDKSDFNNDS
ncbi:UNVERIFIED_CONTAM: hypothetical protein FKN15_034794 [Acipenser sinensis]